MSKKIKILLVLAIAVLVAAGSVFYIVSTKIDPKVIKESVISSIEGSLQGVDASIGDISYSLGMTVKLNVKELKIVEKKKSSPMLFLKQARVEVPIFSILTGGGTVDIKVENPEISFEEIAGGSSNWQRALPAPSKAAPSQAGSAEKSKSGAKPKKEDGSVKLPSFVENSRIDLKILDLNLNYRPLGAKESQVQVNKILLKNLNLKKTTAFEVVSKINYSLDREKTMSAALQLVGEVALNNLLEKGAVDTNMLLNVDDIKLSWLDVNIPDLKNTIKFKMKENGEIWADVRAKAGSLLSLETDVNVDKEFKTISLDKTSIKTKLGSLPGALGETLAKSFEGIDLGKSEFNASGKMEVNLSKMAISPDLKFSIEKPLILNAAGVPVSISLAGKFVGQDVAVKVKNELLSGVATLDAQTKINPMNLPESLNSYKQVDARLLITNIKLEKDFIQKMLYGSESDRQESEKKAENAGQASGEGPALEEPAPVSFPPFNLTLEGKHIFVSNQEMNVNGKINGRNGKVNIPDFNIHYGSGKASVKAKALINTTQDIKSDFSVSLSDMDMRGLNVFLPPMISEVKGKYEGKVYGSLKKGKTLSYDVKTDVKATNGELKNLNLSSFILPLVDSISLLKGKVDGEKMKISDQFDKLSLKANASERFVSIENFHFSGNKNSVVVKAKGKVSMAETGSSKVTAQLLVADIQKDLKTYTGYSDIPVLLEGKGFVLLPQAKYTSDKITERAAKLELSKQKKQINKKINKEKKKLEKQLEKKAKDLLKGFKL